MFLGLLAAPDLFADDRVLLSYLAITDDIGRYFFFSFLLFFSSFFFLPGRKFIAMNIGGRIFLFRFSLRWLFVLFFLFPFFNWSNYSIVEPNNGFRSF